MRSPIGFGTAAIVCGALALCCCLATLGCQMLECDKGTLEREGKCVIVDDLLECGVGFTVEGNQCVPGPEWVESRCGLNATYDPKTNTCVGTGGGAQDACPKTCGTPTETQICVSGRVFHAPSLIMKWAGLSDEATPVEPSENAVIKVYEPIDYVTDPTKTTPLATAPVEENGCFFVEKVPVPYTRLYAIAVDDVDENDNPIWAFAAIGEEPVPSKNSVDLEIPALSDEVATAWGNNFLEQGTMFMVFRHFDSAKEGMEAWGPSVEGILPLVDGLEPSEWTDPTIGPFYMDADVMESPYFDSEATVTTPAGIVALRNIEVKGYSGKKEGCNVEVGLGGSAPGTLFFRWYKVEGCAPTPGE